MYAATGEPNVKWGAPMSNGGTGHHCPRWRRPCRGAPKCAKPVAIATCATIVNPALTQTLIEWQTACNYRQWSFQNIGNFRPSVFQEFPRYV